jgi:hypothetical protein
MVDRSQIIIGVCVAAGLAAGGANRSFRQPPTSDTLVTQAEIDELTVPPASPVTITPIPASPVAVPAVVAYAPPAKSGTAPNNETDKLNIKANNAEDNRGAASPTEVPVAPTTVDQALALLKSANIAFNTPEKARVGKQFGIEAKFSKHLSAKEIKNAITEPGEVQASTLRVSEHMIAILSGGSAFDISPSGPQTQWISEKEINAWSWQITPKAVGNQYLNLTFDVILIINGKEDRRTINTFKRSISVEVEWPQTMGEWLELINKFVQNINSIWAVLFVVVAAIWAAIKRRKSKNPTSDKLLSGED